MTRRWGMGNKDYLVIGLILVLSIVLVGTLPVMGLGSTETTSWQHHNNYANVGAGGGFTGAYSCASYGGDSDNDGICDNWEVSSGSNAGLDISYTSSVLSNTPVTYVYNLPCVPGNTYANDPTGLTVCPSPTKKDIYLELDCMTGMCPDPQAITDVINAFNNQGIALHVQWGENPSASSGDIGLFYCNVFVTYLQNNPTSAPATGPCSTTNTDYQSYTWLKENRFGTSVERSGNTAYCPSNALPTNAGTVPNANSYNCLTAKRQVFHYVMFVNYQTGNPNYSGWGEVTGNDMIVSLGNYENGVGTIDEQEAEIMHELGHNLGLDHGGRSGVSPDTNNCKPNYLSVMSYTYLFRKSNDICRPLDYSNTALSTLTESSLQDSNVGSDPYPSNNPPPPTGTAPGQPSTCPTSGERSIYWSTPSSTRSGTTGTVNDWNGDGVNSNSYSQVLNNLPPVACSYGTTTTLNGFNDWSYINNGGFGNKSPLTFRNSSNFYQKAPQADMGHDMGTDSHSDLSMPQVVPEFGPAASIIMVLAIVSVIVITMRMRRISRLI